jgi:5-formyltetrahydrofolate cyclo-ligase
VQDDPKPAWRQSLSAARRARPDADIAAARSAVADRVLARCSAAGWTAVAAYVPLRTEPGSTGLLDGLAALGVRVIVPVVRPDRDLDWAPWPAGSPLLGLDALASVDTVLVPALAVSASGVRLGRGGGSYDRALSRRRHGVPAIALLFDGEMVAELPSEPWDEPVTEVVTPSGWTVLGPPRVDGNAAVGDHG